MLQPRHATRVPRPRLSRLRGRPVIATVALVATVGLISGAAPAYVAVADGDISLSQGDRVLQSVDIEMGPDGTLNSVVSNAVAATSDGSPSDTSTDTFSPDEVVDDLPVRVVTSYRTADGAGTDLSELKGYTGKVAIDLTVQNLTVTPKDISYDVDGASRSQPALVGVPLTVVASTTLPDVPGASVVTAEKNKNDSTNGVLSQSQDGTTQVQWATILAPPQLGSSARLSLVVDAKDFTPPTFDLSVQPGLVTDTSVGALVESVFDPQASDELDLQARTIEVIGDVNAVLGRAGASISNVRTTLNASAETLGQKTVGDLESSVTEITSSMRDLDGTITGLGDDLSKTLESTGSSSIEQLQESVANVDKLLGDTSAKALPPRTTGQGCDIQIGTTGGAKTVFGSLLRVGSRLQAFAQASDQCKIELQNQLARSIGPGEPNEQSCLGENSVTCSIFGAAETTSSIALALAGGAEQARTTLKTDIQTQVVSPDGAINESTEGLQMVEKANALEAAVDKLSVGESSEEFLPLTEVLSLRKAFVETAKGISGNLNSVITELAAVIDRLYALATDICNDMSTQAVSLDVGNRLIGTLVESYPENCGPLGAGDGPDVPDAAVPAPPAAGPSLEETLGTQTANLSGMSGTYSLDEIPAELTSIYTVTGPEGLATQVKAFDDSLLALKKALTQAVDETGKPKTLGQLADDVSGQAALLKGQAEVAIDQIDTAVNAAETSAATGIDTKIQEGIRQVTDQSKKDRADVGKAFDQSTASLNASARDIVVDGRTTVRAQRDDLTSSQKKAADGLSKIVNQGLDQIAKGVTSSTRDNKAVNTLLTADLTKVLQDIGESGDGGSGLLGSLATNAATAGTADFQVALATRTTSSYANVRGQDIAGILLRQAQSEASLQAQASMAAFGIDIPTGVERRTVYTFHVAGQ